MARRSKSILDDLVVLPWWFSVVLAAIVYFAMKYWVPTVAIRDPIFSGMAMAAPGFARYAAGFLLIIAAMSAFNAWRKGQLLDRQNGIGTLRAISWREFEELVGEAYRRKGYAVTENGGGGADGGVDLVLRRNGEELLVQCKHWKSEKVGVKIVRELFGVIAAQGASGGIVITSGSFTQEAMDFARGKPMELVNGSGLLRLIGEVQKKPKIGMPVGESRMPKAPVPIDRKPKAENTCPVCGAEMVLRRARKGANAGEQFWGCSGFPKCRGIKPYNG